MTKEGWGNRKKFEVEQFGSEKLAREARSRQAKLIGAKGGGSKKRDPSTRAFSDVKLASKAGKLGALKAWADREKERIKGGKED